MECKSQPQNSINFVDNKRLNFFEPNFLANPKFDFVKFIGSYSSIVEQFADAFEVQTNKNQQANRTEAWNLNPSSQSATHRHFT